MTSYTTDGSVGPWAKEKLKCLRDYLEPYTTILRGEKFRYYYIDAFAGAGQAKLRVSQDTVSTNITELFDAPEKSTEEEEYINGSPYEALSIKHPFQAYLFIEYNISNAQKLEHLKTEFPKLKDRIKIKVGDANKILLDSVVNNKAINWRGSRAVVFLDPFGMQVSWSTIKSLSETKAIEVIINNPIQMVVQRLLEKEGKITKERRRLITDYFGCEQWEEIVYSEEEDLFGTKKKVKAYDASIRLGRFYNERLKEAFGYAATVRLVRNSAGSPIYFLHWAGPNATGKKIASHVLAQGETI